jgi:hypothetical protein
MSQEDDPSCARLGCVDAGQWCMTRHEVQDTDGGDFTMNSCVDLPRECAGLTGVELEMCLQPLCCDYEACPQVLDETEMHFECYSDPGTSCGSCNFD